MRTSLLDILGIFVGTVLWLFVGTSAVLANQADLESELNASNTPYLSGPHLVIYLGSGDDCFYNGGRTSYLKTFDYYNDDYEELELCEF
jgi:hypothetical protein